MLLATQRIMNEKSIVKQIETKMTQQDRQHPGFTQSGIEAEYCNIKSWIPKSEERENQDSKRIEDSYGILPNKNEIINATGISKSCMWKEQVGDTCPLGCPYQRCYPYVMDSPYGQMEHKTNRVIEVEDAQQDSDSSYMDMSMSESANNLTAQSDRQFSFYKRNTYGQVECSKNENIFGNVIPSISDVYSKYIQKCDPCIDNKVSDGYNKEAALVKAESYHQENKQQVLECEPKPYQKEDLSRSLRMVGIGPPILSPADYPVMSMIRPPVLSPPYYPMISRIRPQHHSMITRVRYAYDSMMARRRPAYFILPSTSES